MHYLLIHSYTVNVERFAGLNIGPMKFFVRILSRSFGQRVYYLAIAKYSQENFCGMLKNRESLAQSIFQCLQ